MYLTSQAFLLDKGILSHSVKLPQDTGHQTRWMLGTLKGSKCKLSLPLSIASDKIRVFKQEPFSSTSAPHPLEIFLPF